MNKYISIISLKGNGLIAPTKRHRGAEWIRKLHPHVCCLQESHLRTKEVHRVKVKGRPHKTEVAILISEKIGFKQRP